MIEHIQECITNQCDSYAVFLTHEYCMNTQHTFRVGHLRSKLIRPKCFASCAGGGVIYGVIQMGIDLSYLEPKLWLIKCWRCNWCSIEMQGVAASASERRHLDLVMQCFNGIVSCLQTSLSWGLPAPCHVRAESLEYLAIMWGIYRLQIAGGSSRKELSTYV